MKAMNKKLLKWLAITACSLTCATTLSVGVSTLDNPQTVTAYEITFESADALAEIYAQGSTITIPTARIEGIKATDHVVISPSGNGYSSETITLLEAGNYTVRWFARVGGKEVSAEKTFFTEKSAFRTEGTVVCEYKEDLEFAQYATPNEGNFTREDITSEGDGIKVTVGENSTFTYNNVIDLRNFSNDPFIEIHIYKHFSNLWMVTSGRDLITHEDARNYYVTLTDCYDPSKYVTIDLEYLCDGKYKGSLRAAAAGQMAYGLIEESGSKLNIDGVNYSAIPGPTTVYNLYWTPQLGWKLFYDTETQRIYTTTAEFSCPRNDGVWHKRKLAADLANKNLYPDNAFEGFTTGEVYLSISAGDIYDGTANMDITSLGGLRGSDILKVNPDTEKPLIDVDERFSTMKTIALNEEITIPDAYAFDPGMLYGNVAKKTVYYNYDPNSATNALVGIVNGKFTPKKTGKYTIVYTATDISNNSSTLTVDLECVEATGGKAITLTTTPIEMEAGSYADIPECTISGLYTDEANLKLYYTNEDGEQVLYTDSQILLNRLGEFKFTYVYETQFATYTATAVITSTATDKVGMSSPVLPDYFIKNAKYTLDPVWAYEYTETATKAVPSKMYMKADGGEYVEVDPQEVMINANNTVQFKYVYGAGLVESKPVKVLDVGFGGALSTKEYFYTESTNVTKNATKDYLQFITSGSSTKSTLAYINPLAMSSFDIEFNFVSKDKAGATYVAPACITFTFTDYYDRSKVATFSLRPAKAGLYVDVNGVQRVGQLPGRKFLDLKNYICYQNGVMKFEGVDYDMGKVITSDRVLFEMTIENSTSGKSCMNLLLLCDNTLTSAKFDTTNPKLTIAKTNMGYHAFNSVITIGKAIASDLIAPYLESGLKVTVTTPDGSFAKSEDGITLDGTNPVDREYQVKLSQVGFYSVFYTYTDQNGGEESFTYSPIVKDEQGPTLVVEGKVEEEVVSAKWGASVTVATYSVSDDISEASKVKSFVDVIYPSGIMRGITNGGSFYAEEKGLYRVVYYAFDEVGNMSWFTYYVQVS